MILVFDIAVAFVVAILVVGAHFVASQFLGFVCDLYGGTAAGVAAAIATLLVGVLHVGMGRWVVFPPRPLDPILSP